MLWRAATRCALRRSKLRSVIGECLDSKYLQRRPLLATRSAKEQTDHWDTSWLEEDPWSSSNDIPPKTEDVSTQDAPTWSVSRGVSIDKRGQLKVTSSTDADKEYPAVLVVSAASRNLSRADFTRLLAEKDRLEQGGIKAIIQGRDATTLKRLPYWILLFRSPLAAASYQSRLRWYHRNAVENLPVNPLQAALIPGRGLTPHPGYIDPESGEDVWERLHEYCLLQPAQDFRVTALLPGFPPSILQAIQRDGAWNDFRGARSWAVLIWLSGAHCDKDEICRFLEDDGKARHRPWDIHHKPVSICGHEQSRYVAPMAVHEENDHSHTLEESQIFSVKFCGESEAMRFWRTWHRMPFPRLAKDTSAPEHQAPLLHVEPTW